MYRNLCIGRVRYVCVGRPALPSLMCEPTSPTYQGAERPSGKEAQEAAELWSFWCDVVSSVQSGLIAAVVQMTREK